MSELDELNLEAMCLECELEGHSLMEFVDPIEINALINELYYIEGLIQERLHATDY